MARIVKEEEYLARRNEILNVAQQFIYSKGYHVMSVQDILNHLGISKGAFYHYFDSKQALLEALIERMEQEAEQVILPVIDDPHLPVLEKLERFFVVGVRWKTERKNFFLGLMRVWYADENALVRQKVEPAMIKRFTPMIAGVIRQGVQEGVMDTPFPDESAVVVLSLLQGMSASFVDLLFKSDPVPQRLQRAGSIVAGYTDALERILGVPPGSLQIIDSESLKEWFVLSEETDQESESLFTSAATSSELSAI